MREILFKGIDINSGELVFGSYFNANTGHTIIENGGSSIEDFHFINIETISQYTGLNDKKDVKIFEWDKVVFLTYSQQAGEYSNGYESELKTGVIQFKDGCFGIEWDDEEIHFHKLNKQSATRIEVVGNIHDEKNK